MGGWDDPSALSVTAEQRRPLRAMVNRSSARVRDYRRAWIILNRADGLSQVATATTVAGHPPVVIKWERRFARADLAGLAEVKGRGRKPSLAPALREKIIVRATQPPAHRTRWSGSNHVPEHGRFPGHRPAPLERQ